MDELQRQTNININSTNSDETTPNNKTQINTEFHKSENNAVSVIFITHNRRELLYQALSAVQQQTLKVDIIVMDDASTDGTDQMIASSFPDITYRRSDKNLGPSHQRNEGAKLAKSEIIFFLDDDTIVQDKNTFEVILNDFSQPNFGAVTIPFINVLQNDTVLTGAPSTNKHFLYHAFIAAAFAVRRDIFLKLGGFREEYFYMGEEDDFSIRLLNAGYFVKAGTSQPVHHHQPAGRISYSADFYGRRNDILFYFLNCPRIYFLPFLMLTVVKSIIYGLKVGRLKTMLKGTVSGLKLLFNQNIKKTVKPVSSDVFLKFRQLKLNGPIQW